MEKSNGSLTTHITKNYGMFVETKDNRPIQVEKRGLLRKSMMKYGYLPEYPVVCVRGKDKKLYVRDGQHRLKIAEELGLPVHYVITEHQAEIWEVNNTQKAWSMRDTAMCFAGQGNKQYLELLDFAEQNTVPLNLALQLLSDQACANGSNLTSKFRSGGFVVKNRQSADRVMKLYHGITKFNKAIKDRFFLDALISVCRLAGVEDDRFTRGASRAAEHLKKYGTRDGYLEMLEELYNYGRSKKTPIKVSAQNAVASRNAAKKRAEAKAEA